MLPLAVESVTGSILTTVLGSILCKSLFSTEFKKSSVLMSSTFFMLPLANRISEPLVKLDVLAACEEGGDSGAMRRIFFDKGSTDAMILLLLLLLLLFMLLLLLLMAGTATVEIDGGGGNIRCCCCCCC